MELGSSDFKGEGSTPNKAELYYELRNGVVGVAYPVFVDGTEISKSGYVKETDRRAELAKLIVNSEFMPKVMVNRMWGHFPGMALPSRLMTWAHTIRQLILSLLEKLAPRFPQEQLQYQE